MLKKETYTYSSWTDYGEAFAAIHLEADCTHILDGHLGMIQKQKSVFFDYADFSTLIGSSFFLTDFSKHLQNRDIKARSILIHTYLTFNFLIMIRNYQKQHLCYLVKLFTWNNIDAETWFLSGDNVPLEYRQIALDTFVPA